MNELENSPVLRPLPDVVKAVLNIIPDSVQEKSIINLKLQTIVSNYQSSTLSNLAEVYQSVQKVLESNLIITLDSWYDTLIKVYTGQLDYKEYL